MTWETLRSAPLRSPARRVTPSAATLCGGLPKRRNPQEAPGESIFRPAVFLSETSALFPVADENEGGPEVRMASFRRAEERVSCSSQGIAFGFAALEFRVEAGHSLRRRRVVHAPLGEDLRRTACHKQRP